jgi:hypothetical protein
MDFLWYAILGLAVTAIILAIMSWCLGFGEMAKP